MAFFVYLCHPSPRPALLPSELLPRDPAGRARVLMREQLFVGMLRNNPKPILECIGNLRSKSGLATKRDPEK